MGCLRERGKAVRRDKGKNYLNLVSATAMPSQDSDWASTIGPLPSPGAPNPPRSRRGSNRSRQSRDLIFRDVTRFPPPEVSLSFFA